MPSKSTSRGKLALRLPAWSGAAGKTLAALAITAAVIWMLMALAGVFRDKVPDGPPRSATTIDATTATAEVQRVNWPRYETAVGTIKPIHEVSVAAKILARVLEVAVSAGQLVEQDQTLVRLDGADLQSRLRQAESGVLAAQARFNQASADFERAASLLPRQAISQNEYDQANAAQKLAAAELERAKQAVQEATITVDYATILAPIRGQIVEKQVEAGDMVAPGQVLLTLYDPERMQMVATVRESLALQLRVGQKLPARVDSLGYECEAMISEIVPEAEAASRSFVVKVTGPCPSGVYSGMFGRLILPLSEESVIVVPTAAVRHVGQLTMVDVVDDETVQRRSVQLGRARDDQIEVLAGLSAGERVVLPTRAGGSGHDDP
jgi:RND family efflux transporter MFP subunit